MYRRRVRLAGRRYEDTDLCRCVRFQVPSGAYRCSDGPVQLRARHLETNNVLFANSVASRGQEAMHQGDQLSAL